jgi:hypothetical protein
MKNAERDARIVQMRKAGLWPREIAAQLGVTKNVVIGVANRAGLCQRGQSAAGLRAAVAAHAVNFCRGERCPSAVLNERKVQEIRDRYRPYCRQNGASQIAREFGVNVKTVVDALAGRTWGHVQ